MSGININASCGPCQASSDICKYGKLSPWVGNSPRVGRLDALQDRVCEKAAREHREPNESVEKPYLDNSRAI